MAGELSPKIMQEFGEMVASHGSECTREQEGKSALGDNSSHPCCGTSELQG